MQVLRKLQPLLELIKPDSDTTGQQTNKASERLREELRSKLRQSSTLVFPKVTLSLSSSPRYALQFTQLNYKGVPKKKKKFETYNRKEKEKKREYHYDDCSISSPL